MTSASAMASLWAKTVPAEALVEGVRLPGDLDVDVAIVGAGLTGLWTAYYLATADRGMRIAVLERERVGFGASGRNGGWCSGLLAAGLGRLERRHGRSAAVAMQQQLHGAVDEVGRVIELERIDAQYAKGGTVSVARTAAQQQRLTDELAEARSFGLGDGDLRWLEPDELAARCRMAGARAALYTPHCAALHPMRLVHGLASAVRRCGVVLHDRTSVVEVVPGEVRTDHGRVRAGVVVVATEAYTATLPGRRRDLVPLYSLMVGTEPLDADQWEQIGLAARETFHDARHLIIYGQRTADGRLAFGGRGAPYHFGSRIEPGFDTDERVRTILVGALRELFPVVNDVDVPYHWGGPLGVPRDWEWSAQFDRTSGLAWAGGYVGDGVSTTNVAGRTLADLIHGVRSDLTELPWAEHRQPRWEPEPLRWMGINFGRRAAARADRAEQSTGRWADARSKAWSRALSVVTGR